MNLGGIIFVIGLIMTIHGVFSLLSGWMNSSPGVVARGASSPPGQTRKTTLVIKP